MLERLTPGELEEWLAFREIEPDWRWRMLEVMKNGFAALSQAWGVELKPEDFDPFKGEAGIAAKQESEVSPQQAAAMVSTVLGAPD